MILAMGRPKVMERKAQVLLPPALAERVEDFRFSNRINTEAEAIRRLIEAGLDQLQAAQATLDAPKAGGTL